MGLIDIGIAHT